MRMFNKDTDMTYSEFINKYNIIYPDLPICKWIDEKDMTDKEKKEVKDWKTTGGYLKTLTYKEAWAEYWSKANKEEKDFFLNLPNFNADIFKEITGIDVNEKMITIKGKKYSENTIAEALKKYVEEK